VEAAAQEGRATLGFSIPSATPFLRNGTDRRQRERKDRFDFDGARDGTYADYWPQNFEGIATCVSDRLFADVEAVRAQVGSKLVAEERGGEIPDAQVIDVLSGT
jgi:hypothetical protein